jgi:uncharacterized membrane protein (TIGR02234 family)
MTASRIRLLLVCAALLIGALALVAWTQPWFSLTLTSGGRITVTGQTADPALSGLALASLALAAALTIARRVLRVVLGVILALLGGALTAVTVPVLAAPVAAAASSITATTGVSGRASIEALVSSVATSGWPYAAVAFGVSLTAVGLIVVATAKRWPGASRKYDVGPPRGTGSRNTETNQSPVGTWDALTSGADPTSHPGGSLTGGSRPSR